MTFPPPPPPQGWYPAYPPPPAHRETAVTVVIVAAVSLALLIGGGVVALFLLDAPICSGCPGETPIGADLALGTGHLVCPVSNPPGPGSVDSCAYEFPLTVTNESGPLPASVLSFQIQDGSDEGVSLGFLVVAEAASGCPLGVWSSSTGTWSGSSHASTCTTPNPQTTALVTGDSFWLVPEPMNSSEYDAPGNHLIVMAYGSGWTGEVGAGFAP